MRLIEISNRQAGHRQGAPQSKQPRLAHLRFQNLCRNCGGNLPCTIATSPNSTARSHASKALPVLANSWQVDPCNFLCRNSFVGGK